MSHYSRPPLFLLAGVLLQLVQVALANAGKVYEMSEQLPELVEKHPNKRWFVKFYAPWCHHCQELEPIYYNAAERLYRSHSDLVVAKVDCIKYKEVCHQFGVNGFPTLVYLDGKNQHRYQGERNEDSMVAFVERLQGPTVNRVMDCQSLEAAIQRHGLIILSTYRNSDSAIRQNFNQLAAKYKSTHWFYEHPDSCESLRLSGEGLYVLKRHLKRPIKYTQALVDQTLDSDADIVQWLNSNSVPVYGRISHRNINRYLALDKTVIIAVLDEYKPSRQLTKSSRLFHKNFEQLAIDYTAKMTDDDKDELLFAWCSDLELIQYITIYTKVSAPNVIVVKKDLSHYLMLQTSDDKERDKAQSEAGHVEADRGNLSRLDERELWALLDKAKAGTLELVGSDSYLQSGLRLIMDNVRKFFAMYHANPLLVALIFGLPSSILIFVVYTTCFHEADERAAWDREEDEGYSDYEFSDGEDDGPLLKPQADRRGGGGSEHPHQD